MRALLIALAALLVAPHAEAAKPEGKGKTEPISHVAVDAERFILGHVLGFGDRSLYSGTHFWFFDAESGAAVAVDRNGAAGTPIGSVYFDSPGCTGTAFVFYADVPVVATLLVTADRYFTQRIGGMVTMGVQSRLAGSGASVGCIAVTGTYTQVFLVDEVTPTFLDPIPLPISIVPAD